MGIKDNKIFIYQKPTQTSSAALLWGYGGHYDQKLFKNRLPKSCEKQDIFSHQHLWFGHWYCKLLAYNPLCGG